MAKKSFTPIPPMAELPPAEDINVKELLDKYLTGEIDLICVLGPTASGKTRYAVQLARQINALLADSTAMKAEDCGHRGPCHLKILIKNVLIYPVMCLNRLKSA